MTISPTHPIVLSMARRMARESLDIRPWGEGRGSLWDELSIRGLQQAEAHQVNLLLDFRRSDTRDRWIRWGRNFALDAVMSGDAVRIQRDGPSATRWAEAIRDNPEVLEATVCAALENL